MTIIEMSVGGAVLIAAILLLRRTALFHLPKWAFLLLWAVALFRLLIPFTLPSQLSVLNSAAWVVQRLEETEEPPAPPAEDLEPVWVPVITAPGPFQEEGWALPAVPAVTEPEKEPVPLTTVVWLTGTALCGLFFSAAYLWSLRRFYEAKPADQEFVRRWQEEHPTPFPVKIKTCANLNAPLAYGLLRPVILLPEDTDWSGEGQLTYILTHEYIHVRRGDLFWKLLLTAALCVHWFNPLVWVMYFRANQDLELACDEQVVRKLGLDNRKNYAYALLAAAESGFMPFCTTYKSKNHMEERIRAIMKMKKTSLAAVVTAALLVVGVTAVFATSKAPEPKKIDDLPPAVMTNTDPKPSGSVSAPVEKDKPTTIDRVHPVTGATVQNPGPTAEPVTVPEVSEPSAPVLENRWGVPDIDPLPLGYMIPAESEEDMWDLIDYLCQTRGLTICDISHGHDGGEGWYVTIAYEWSRDPGGKPPADGKDYYNWPASDVSSIADRWNVPADPIPKMTEIRAGTLKDEAELRQYLMQVRGIRAGDMAGGINSSGTHSILITYEQTEREKRLANGYPVNSRGETYGSSFDRGIMGYEPDLVAVVATDTRASGYTLKEDCDYFDMFAWAEKNNKKSTTREDVLKLMEDFKAWASTQPSVKEIPVYDVDRNNILGYFKIYNDDGYDYTISQEEIEWRLNALADKMREWGNSEEQIARELEEYKASQGWS